MVTQLVDGVVDNEAKPIAPNEGPSGVASQPARQIGDDHLLWPLVANILAAQRGRPYPELEKILGENPLAGLPPGVKNALEQTAKAYELSAHDDAASSSEHAGKEKRVEHSPAIDGRARYDLERFCANHRLSKPRDREMDEHFAERKFLELVVLPVLGPAGLRRLTPQESFIEPGGKQRRIDFVLRGAGTYALEVEGATYHALAHRDESDYDDETRRRRALAARGYTYYPFTYGEILSGAARDAFRRVCLSDATLARLLVSNSGVPGASETGADAIVRRLRIWAPERFTEVQRALLPLLADWTAAGKSQVIVLNREGHTALLNLAFSELVTCAEQTAKLFHLTAALPQITICTPIEFDTETAPLHLQVLRTYLHAQDLGEDAPRAPGQSEQVVDRRTHDRPTLGQVRHIVLASNAVAERSYDAAFCVEYPALQPVQDHGCPWYSLIDSPKLPTLPCSVNDVLRRARQDGDSADAPTKAQEALRYFARRLFQIGELKPQQIQVIWRLLQGNSQLAILPTGFGKSLCYQLPALLIPGVIFVVSPLRALMRDQMYGLERRGLTCAGAVMFEDGTADRERKMRWLREGRFRLFYIAPERVQVKAFADEMREIIESGKLAAWALAVDEAHCVSEWGHDFRVSYLQLGRFRRSLTADGPQSMDTREPLPVLALTATASRWVERDVCNILGIDADASQSVMRAGSVDRPEISLSVHEVSAQGKSSELTELLTHTLNDTLHDSLNGETLIPPQSQPVSAATVIFSPYANGHNRSSAAHNLTTIAHNLVASGAMSKEQVRIHASTQPQVCPACHSGDCINESQDRRRGFRCRSCGQWSERLAPLVGDDAVYTQQVRKNQDQFAANRFPVLVATKAFGMGIDKGNIRAIVHYAFADGIESYVQEIGRAGRDTNHAHAALLFSPPVPRCAEQLKKAVALETARDRYEVFQPPCAKDPENRQFWKCPYGLPGLCDYGLKARNFAGEGYSEQESVANALGVYQELSSTPGADHWLEPRKVQVSSMADSQRDDRVSVVQFGLYRLLQIGVVQDWFLDYRSGGLKNPLVEVRTNANWTLATGLCSTRDALLQLASFDQTKYETEIGQELRAIEQKHHRNATSDQVKALLGLLLSRTLRLVQAMRYYMLWNELLYATVQRAQASGATGKSSCRRVALWRAFDEQLAETANYQCGFCDCCCANQDKLTFGETKAAAPPTHNQALDDLSQRLPIILRAFDGTEVERAVQIARDNKGLEGLEGQAEQRLVTDPDNLSALAIAGGCAEVLGNADTALLHFGSALLVLENGTRDLDTAQYFYYRAKAIEPVRALNIIDRRGGMFDTATGRRFLLEEMKRTHAAGLVEESRVHALRLRVMADNWRQHVTDPIHEASGDLLHVAVRR